MTKDIVEIKKDGKTYYADGKYIVKTNSGGTHYYVDGILHRDNGPAVVGRKGGFKQWYSNGKLHRDGGPALSMTKGCNWWYQHGMRHREDGPAYMNTADNSRTYWLYDKEYTEKEFNEWRCLAQVVDQSEVEELKSKLWSSDEASALTNQAARMIEQLQNEIKWRKPNGISCVGV